MADFNPKSEFQSPKCLSRILVVRVGALGDTLMVTPLLRRLHERQPGAEVDFFCSQPAAPLVELNPHIAHLFSLRARNLPFILSAEKQRLVRALRAREYDLAVLLESAPRYRTLIERARPREIRSFEETPFDAARHAIFNNLNVAGISGAGEEVWDMELPLATADEAAADRMLSTIQGPRIGVHIGWGPQGRKQRQALRLRGWNLANFVELIRRLVEKSGAHVILTGSREDAPDTRLVAAQTPAGHVHSLAGTTRVGEMAALIKRLDLLISVDSGPCHMAAALGTPLVVLWGPGRIEQTKPVSTQTPIRIIRHSVPCAPCQSTPLQKKCRRNLCMELITPDAVFDAARDLAAFLNT